GRREALERSEGVLTETVDSRADETREPEDWREGEAGYFDLDVRAPKDVGGCPGGPEDRVAGAGVVGHLDRGAGWASAYRHDEVVDTVTVGIDVPLVGFNRVGNTGRVDYIRSRGAEGALPRSTVAVTVADLTRHPVAEEKFVGAVVGEHSLPDIEPVDEIQRGVNARSAQAGNAGRLRGAWHNGI